VSGEGSTRPGPSRESRVMVLAAQDARENKYRSLRTFESTRRKPPPPQSRKGLGYWGPRAGAVAGGTEGRHTRKRSCRAGSAPSQSVHADGWERPQPVTVAQPTPIPRVRSLAAAGTGRAPLARSTAPCPIWGANRRHGHPTTCAGAIPGSVGAWCHRRHTHPCASCRRKPSYQVFCAQSEQRAPPRCESPRVRRRR